ncbi:hypothetical protein [Aquibacillus kalidii]|uniref:hypothetical protein n=1 Tax=Aquibacillus kalidii TaxID=2762597 RepID=UPI001F47E639|nr:hypothetical protein [Aquibacillus kalidii]
MNTTSLISSAVFIGLICIIFTVLEQVKVNDRQVHFVTGMGIILFGGIFDSLMV